MNQQAIVVGSLSDVAQKSDRGVAETFIDADVVIVVDTSGSMCATDSRGGKSRYDIALEELAKLQRSMPGKIAVIAFSDIAIFVPGGQPPFLSGGTNLAGALRFAKVADVSGIRFVVISDGEPDSRDDALAVARTYRNRIDVIYVGPEEQPEGRAFLAQLARTSGGQAVTADRMNELAEAVTLLLRE